VPTDLGALLADLADETAALNALTAPLDDAGSRQPTPAPGWTIADQIGHLAYFDETVVMAATDPAEFIAYRAQIEAAGGLLVTQRRHLADAGLDIQGAAAAEWMAIAQAFAGPPGAGRAPGQFPAPAPDPR
jgi:Mycothiol maleylpyruvate isomerase N-terminal domain